MKKKIIQFSFIHIYFLLLLVLILLVCCIPKIQENFISFNKIKNKKSNSEEDQKLSKKDNNSVVNLSCKIGKDNEYNCTRFESKPIVKNIKMNYPPLLYDTGIGPSNSEGSVKFKTKFKSIPQVYCTPISDPKNTDISSISISVYNVTKSGFQYEKSKISSKKEYNGLTSLGEDNKNKFNWLAISEPPKNPFKMTMSENKNKSSKL